ncbi:MAG TPA: type II CAAX endopeptidase family protein [Segetibacter sp.]|jgi:membrane protease YdiL (CAAX protease family)
MADKSQTSSLVKFFALAYLLSWAIWLPLYLPYFGITSLPVLPFHHGLGALGPILAAFILIYKEEKRKGLNRLVNSMFRLTNLVLLLIALVGPFILLFLATVINYFQTGAFSLSGITRTREFPSFSFPVYFLYNLVFFGFGEETGWKGYALPRLQTKFSPLTSSAVFAFFWAIWHIPLFLYRPGYSSMDVAGVAGWFFSLLTGSVLLTWLFNSSKGSILVCAVFHATIDIVFVSDFIDKNVVNYLGMLISIWAVATIPALLLKNNKRVTSG